MAEQRRRRHHRGRRRRKKQKQKGSMITTIVLIISIIVFCVAAFQLIRIAKGYLDGRSEYEKVRDVAVENEKDRFRVNFDELMKINGDTIGWIRFNPEPSQINYPIVQAKDNDLYLHKTFSDNENTLGAIFLNVENSEDFSDKNSIIYGHRMKDGSMFRHLEDYKDKEFWKENPYFYIYTLDGKEITYHIYSVGVVEDTSEVYRTEFASDEEYQAFLDTTKEAAEYDTGVEVGTDDTVITLSTCTKASDNHRFVVLGIKEKEVELEE